MSQENVEVRNEVVRRWFAAFDDDDDAFRETLHPEVEWFPFEENHTPSYGIEGAMRNRKNWLETWDEHQFELGEVIEAGDDVVASVHIWMKGKTSGVGVDIRFYAHFKVRDGKVAHIFDHQDRAAALQAAGLSE